jgi:hypothetical protein
MADQLFTALMENLSGNLPLAFAFYAFVLKKTDTVRCTATRENIKHLQKVQRAEGGFTVESTPSIVIIEREDASEPLSPEYTLRGFIALSPESRALQFCNHDFQEKRDAQSMSKRYASLAEKLGLTYRHVLKPRINLQSVTRWDSSLVEVLTYYGFERLAKIVGDAKQSGGDRDAVIMTIVAYLYTKYSEPVYNQSWTDLEKERKFMKEWEELLF